MSSETFHVFHVAWGIHTIPTIPDYLKNERQSLSVTLCARASRTILGHVPIGEYRTRFFPNEPTACTSSGSALGTPRTASQAKFHPSKTSFSSLVPTRPPSRFQPGNPLNVLYTRKNLSLLSTITQTRFLRPKGPSQAPKLALMPSSSCDFIPVCLLCLWSSR